MIRSGRRQGYVRTFAAGLDVLKQAKLRCNARYDVLLSAKYVLDAQRAQLPIREQNKQQKLDQNKSRGILGLCEFRACSMFDVGYSFMSDSLHNVYIGAFVSVVIMFSRQEELPLVDNMLTELTEKVINRYSVLSSFRKTCFPQVTSSSASLRWIVLSTAYLHLL